MTKTGKSMSFAALIILIILIVNVTPLHAAKQDGVITGKLVDAETGESVIGAAVQVEGTTIGAQSDLDGNFVIRKVPLGEQVVIVQCIGYAKIRIDKVQVTADKAVELNLTLKRQVIDAGVVVEVTAEALQNNEASLLRDRQLSNTVSDAISAEAISRSGSGDAASAVKRVTGVSVVGGKYVYVRGLGDRYVNAKLNGATLPSSDPDKQSFPMDMIPSGLLDKIVVEKTFTPDQSADFAGGSVNIGTKSLQGRRVLEFATSFGYNSQVTGNSGFLTYTGGSHDWLASDDGTRALPDYLSDPSIKIPSLASARRDTAQAMLLDQLSKDFANQMDATSRKAPLDQSYKFSYGDLYSLWGRNLSLIASLSYKRSYSSYNDGTVARWDRAAANVLDDEINLRDSRSRDEVLWGGLVNLQMPVSERSKFKLDYMYTRNGDNDSRYMIGHFNEALAEQTLFETRVLSYVERSTGNLQFSGEHQFGALNNPIKFDWHVSGADLTQDEPNTRYFSDDLRPLAYGDLVDTFFNIQPNQYQGPTALWRNLDETTREVSANLTVPLRDNSHGVYRMKVGMGFLRKKRDFWERRFQIRRDQGDLYWGDVNAYVGADNMGIKETRNGQFVFNNYVEETQAGISYRAWQEIPSAYVMVEMPIVHQLLLTTGARYERTLMQTTGKDLSGTISENDVLPSLGLVYKLHKKINLRASYGKTLARPSLREFAPFSSAAYSQGYLFVGNPELKRTLIDNYDLRFEIFPRPNELAAVSVFWREFHDPIEQSMFNSNNQVQYQNTSKASLVGAEFEVRKSLDMLPGELGNLFLGGNLTLIRTRVKIPELDLQVRRAFDPNASDTRRMQGQPDYVINANLEYSNEERGTTASMVFNVLGKQLAGVSLDGTPDLIELPRPQLDMIASQKLGWGIKAKVSVKNILNSETKRVLPFESDGQDYIAESYKTGVAWSFGLGYSL